MNSAAGRRTPVVIAANRGPAEHRTGPDGRVVQHRGAGGLVNVLGPALSRVGGTWVAAALTPEDRRIPREVVDLPGGPVTVRLLDLDPEVFRGYYDRTSTELLWFLHHQLDTGPFDPAAWASYREVNARFAEACAEEVAPGGVVLFQDYHLALAPRLLRELRPDLQSAHFTMTPWAGPEYFARLPEDFARELIEGMLGADMVAFLAPRWSAEFLACCARLGLSAEMAVRSFPVGVNGEALSQRAGAADVLERKRELETLAEGRRLIVRVERMEPSKNIVRGLLGYQEFLARYPAWRGRVVHFVLSYGSRSSLPAYRAYAEEVAKLADDINRRHGTPDWTPVVLDTRNDFARGLAAMALADVLVVNPVRDGMNLVAKEGPVVSERDLALILSRLAGAADDLAGGCALIDPFDVAGLAEEIAASLDLPEGERAARLELLRKGAVALPPERWLDAVLGELERLPDRSVEG